ncbi:MAG: CheR family methyltransferase, partial [Alphaproteobacteria bacterium]
MQLQPFCELIRQRSGLLVGGGNGDMLEVAITARLRATGAADAAAYLRIVQTDETEFQELLSHVTINETYFFREPAQISFLAEQVMPGLLAKRKESDPVRILSAGCSTGEEPYSIAIALTEAFGTGISRRVSIVGGDIDHHALVVAQRAIYGDFSFRAMPPELKARHFARAGTRSHVLAPAIRAMVEYHQMNLISAPLLPASTGPFDVVFFRNVSIYFDTPTRRTIQEGFRSIMGEGSLLFLGISETLANDLGVFRMVETQNIFHFVNGTADVPPSAARIRPPVARKTPSPPPPIPFRKPVAFPTP